MRTFLLTAAFLAPMLAANAQSRECSECIPWSAARPLQWGDFRGKPDKSSPNKAMTDSGMSIAMSCEGGVGGVSVRCYFDPTKSWTKTTDSDRLLSHEQLHFDITELFVRKLRQKLEALGTDCQRLSKGMKQVYESNYTELGRYQEKYDRETKHSIDTAQQRRWEEQVRRELGALDRYRSDGAE